jgi:hypothetical protein
MFMIFRKLTTICATIVITTLLFVSAYGQSRSSRIPMEYRSIAFHIKPVPELIKLGARLGFNDVTFHTEGNTLRGLKRLNRWDNEKGYFNLIEKHDMTISVWVHELDNYKESWGPVSVDNETLWNKLRSRYDYYLDTLVPEIDHLVLTVVETQINVTDKELLGKLVKVLNQKCREHDKQLIVRSFVHEPEEYESVTAAIEKFPHDVKIQTKIVPQDWHLASPVNPFIGKLEEHDQYVEFDINGEYFRNEHIPNCFTDKLYNRFQYIKKKGVKGINVRVDRYPRKNAWWEPLRIHSSVYGQAQEVNLWVLGYLASGKSLNPEEPWHDWVEKTFGEDAAPEMMQALKPTGKVLEEALSVQRESFGVTRNKIPAEWSMDDTTAYAYPDEKDNKKYLNPFHVSNSPHRWFDSLNRTYHKIRRGHPAIVRAKEKSYQRMLDTINESIRIVDYNKDELPVIGSYPFFKFKLEESRFHLKVMCEAALAWLKMAQRLYYIQNPELTKNYQTDVPVKDEEVLLEEVRNHLNNLRRLQRKTQEDIYVQYKGRDHYLQRGQYIDIPGYVELFSKYWGLENNLKNK